MATGEFTIVNKYKGAGASATSTVAPAGRYEASFGAAAPTLLLTVDESTVALYRNAQARVDNLPWIQLARTGGRMTINEEGTPKELAAKKKKKAKKAAGDGSTPKKAKKRKADAGTGEEKAAKKAKKAAGK